jgi:hypothetical protein
MAIVVLQGPTVPAGASGTTTAPISTSAAKAAVEKWFSDTNKVWTTNNFSSVDQITTGSARAVYVYEEHQLAASNHSTPEKPFTLSDLSVVVPCQSATTKSFVAYATTNFLSLGTTKQASALIFKETGGTWKLAAGVKVANAGETWPKLCTGKAATDAAAIVPPTDVPSRLAATLTRYSVATALPSSDAAPFAPLTWFVGKPTTSVQTAFKTTYEKDAPKGVTFSQKFTTTSYPTWSWPLADGKGYWVVGNLTQEITWTDPAGNTTTTWPDGSTVAIPKPSTVHHQVNKYFTTYAATDALSSSAGRVGLDGFWGLGQQPTSS